MSNLKIDVSAMESPQVWASTILAKALEHPGETVAQKLVGAILAKRFKRLVIPQFSVVDGQIEQVGVFTVAQLVYHITAIPSSNVLQKCAKNITDGLLPILLISCEQVNKARILAQDEGIDKYTSIISIEDFVAMSIIGLATEEDKERFTVLKEIIEIYNQRLSAVETDLSLQVEVR